MEIILFLVSPKIKCIMHALQQSMDNVGFVIKKLTVGQGREGEGDCSR